MYSLAGILSPSSTKKHLAEAPSDCSSHMNSLTDETGHALSKLQKTTSTLTPCCCARLGPLLLAEHISRTCCKLSRGGPLSLDGYPAYQPQMKHSRQSGPIATPRQAIDKICTALHGTGLQTKSASKSPIQNASGQHDIPRCT